MTVNDESNESNLSDGLSNSLDIGTLSTSALRRDSMFGWVRGERLRCSCHSLCLRVVIGVCLYNLACCSASKDELVIRRA